MSGFTTTPDERIGPGPPYSNPSLEANLFFRVCLGILAPIACWVPMRLLWRNGEFSAAAFCIVTMILNFYYVVNALLWRDNNVQNWFAGYGWCDLQVYTIFALETVYSASVFSIMRNLANRVGLMRATSLTSKEKKRRNLVEGLVLLPAALVQVIVTYLVLAQRYNVSTLIGCTSAYDTSWPFLVFFDLPSPIYAVGAAVYAGEFISGSLTSCGKRQLTPADTSTYVEAVPRGCKVDPRCHEHQQQHHGTAPPSSEEKAVPHGLVHLDPLRPDSAALPLL